MIVSSHYRSRKLKQNLAYLLLFMNVWEKSDPKRVGNAAARTEKRLKKTVKVTLGAPRNAFGATVMQLL